MLSAIPRMAHRCYHQWSIKSQFQKRNGYGALICVKTEICNRCNLKMESTELVIPANNSEQVDEGSQLANSA